MANIIIISGPQAAGKTSLVDKIKLQFGSALPVFEKDTYKEALFDTIGVDDLELSQKQGAASWDLLFFTLEQLAGTNGTYVFEANFGPQHRLRLEQIELRSESIFDQVLLFADAEVLADRVLGRVAEGKRHPGHVDALRSISVVGMEQLLKMQADFANLSGDRLEIDTTREESIDYSRVIRLIKRRMTIN